jgi:hypothetical protein
MKKETITQFLSNNDKSLGTVGILLGAAAFTNNAQIKIIGQIISFILVATALLVWSEIFVRFKQGNDPNERLTFFITLLFFAFLSVILYWALEFGALLRFFLAAVLLQVVYVHMTGLRHFQTRGRRVVLWLVLFLLTGLVSIPLNAELNRFHKYLLTKQGTPR